MPDPDDQSAERLIREPVLRRMLAVVLVVVVVWLLKTADTVFLPLAFALFLIGLFWPLQRRLQEWMPKVAAMLLTLFTFLLVSAAFGWAMAESFAEVAAKAPEYEDEFRGIVSSVQDRLGMGADGGGGLEAWLQDYALGQSGRVTSLLGGLILVVAYFVLGLLEVFDYRRKLELSTKERRHRSFQEPIHRIARDFQAYMVIRTGVGLLTGVGVFLMSLLVGLDFALLWGVLNFLLNYIPTLGSILGMIPPVLFGVVQGGWQMGLLAAVAVGGVQLVMGMFVGPQVQGHYLRLSPLVVLVSVAVWEWLWGIPGAFIGVPLTVGLVITLARFESTHWIAVLLSDVDDEGKPQVADPR